MILYLSVLKYEIKLRGEWMNVYIVMKIEKYKNYIYVKKFFLKIIKIFGNIFFNIRFKCVKIIIYGRELGFDWEFNFF